MAFAHDFLALNLERKEREGKGHAKKERKRNHPGTRRKPSISPLKHRGDQISGRSTNPAGTACWSSLGEGAVVEAERARKLEKTP